MRTLTWTGFWLPAVLLYGMAIPPSMAEDEAKAFPILQIMSLDPKEYSLTRLRLRPTSLATIDDDHSG